MEDRYGLVEPVEGGNEYYLVNDLAQQSMKALSAIHKSVPNAKQISEQVLADALSGKLK